jgi:hypothetical protein
MPCAYDPDIFKWSSNDVLVEEGEGVESLVLRGRCDIEFGRNV